MARLEHSVTINRPIQEVFAYLSDIERQPEWVSSMSESRKTSSGPTEVGTTYRQIGKFLGRRTDLECEVTAYEPPTVFAFRGRIGPGQIEMRFTLSSEGPETTRLSQVVEGESGGIFKLADPLLVPIMKKQVEADAETLKGMLESGISAEAVSR